MTRSPKVRSLRRAPHWTFAYRLAGLLVAFAVVSGLVQARLRYFYCEGLGLSFTDPCAQCAEDRAPCPASAFETEQRDCCQRIAMPAMPDGARSGYPRVAPASMVARLPAVPVIRDGWMRRWMRPAPSAASRHGRSRASPPLSSERCATLMVFLT